MRGVWQCGVMVMSIPLYRITPKTTKEQILKLRPRRVMVSSIKQLYWYMDLLGPTAKATTADGEDEHDGLKYVTFEIVEGL